MNLYRPTALALTGGTGALGFAFLQRSFAQNPGQHARLLVRRSSASFNSHAFQSWLARHEKDVSLIDADLRDASGEQLRPLLQTEGGLWHFGALTVLHAKSEDVARQIMEVNVHGTQRLLDAAVTLGASGPFFHVSTAYVNGNCSGIAREDDGLRGQSFRNPYEASKLEAEMRVQRSFAAGASGAIFRPSVVVDDAAGTGGFKMVDACAYAVALALKRGEPFVFRLPADARINLVHSDWVIAAMLDLARTPSGSGRTYHLTAPESTYFRDIIAILQQHVPELKLSFEPNLNRRDMPTASKIFDKAVAELRPYLEADVHFDRANTERDLSSQVTEVPLDLAPFVMRRLRSELA